MLIHERLSRIADFLESHGRDEGGYSDETRREFQEDADSLRSLSSGGTHALYDKREEVKISIKDAERMRYLVSQLYIGEDENNDPDKQMREACGMVESWLESASVESR